MQVTILPAVDPRIVRIEAGFNENGVWYSPRKPRPDALKALDSTPMDTGRREDGARS